MRPVVVLPTKSVHWLAWIHLIVVGATIADCATNSSDRTLRVVVKRTLVSEENVLELPLELKQGFLWIGQLSVGTPPQPFKVLLDTGSADVWFPSKDCISQVCQRLAKFNKDLSSTFATNTGAVTVRYGDGGSAMMIRGSSGSDDITLGPGAVLRNQTFALATELFGRLMERIPFDGIVGLGFKHLARQRQANTFFDNLLGQGLVQQPVFSFYMSHQHELGELHLGGVDERFFQGDIVYANLIEAGHWEFKMNDIRVVGNNQTIGSQPLAEVCSYDRCRTIADTGSVFIAGFTHDVHKLNTALGARPSHNGFYTFPNCDLVHRLPEVVFKIGGQDFALAPTDYVLQFPDHRNPNVLTCYSGIKSQEGIPFWVLGELFLRNFYTVFDLGNRRVGFAPIKHLVV